jgi:putative ABC transport system ATP-binding protein
MEKGGNKVLAVDSVNLSLERQELLLIMGPSGSGKTTLLSIMGCILRPTKGEVRVEERIVSRVDLSGRPDEEILPNIRKQYFGLVFQSFNLFPSLSAVESVLLYNNIPYLKPSCISLMAV